MKKILVGSGNPVKIQAVKESFLKYFDEIEIMGIETESGVPHQPVNSETFTGAENRAEKLMSENKFKDIDFFVGIEGGIIEKYNRWFAFGCMCIIDTNGNKSFGTSPHFELPVEVTNRLLGGEELGVVMDEIMNQRNTKQRNGAIGFFTKGAMDRKELYIPGIIAALVPFNHPQMFFNK